MKWASVLAIRVGSVLAVLILWEIIARSGLLYRDVVPSLIDIGAALVNLLLNADTYGHIGWTAWEVAVALSIGGIAGIAAGILLGANDFLRRSYEPYLYYFGATPKLIFFPVMIMWFGIGPSSSAAHSHVLSSLRKS